LELTLTRAIETLDAPDAEVVATTTNAAVTDAANKESLNVKVGSLT
jgi:hypothetical protein